jgi:alkylhydroperoxidase family enzyme
MSTPTTTEQDSLRSRLPDPAKLIPEVAEIAGAMFKATGNGSIPQTTISLVQLRAGQIIGSTYHTVRQTGDLRKAGETPQRITAVASWHDAPYFTDAERVALELVEAVLTPDPFGERVPDELYAKASAHYDDKACPGEAPASISER